MTSPNSVAIAVRSLTDMQIRDLLNVTTDNLVKAGELNLEWALGQESYPAVDGLLEQNQVVLDGGTNITRRIVLDDAGGVVWCDLYDEDTRSIEDITYPFTMPWRSAKVAAAWDRGEVARCAGKEQLYDIAKLRINSKLLAFVKSVEDGAWACPATPTTKALWGVPTWVVGLTAGVAVGSEGFYGCLPGASGGVGVNWTDVAGIVPSTAGANGLTPTGGKDRWRNWAGCYGAVNAALLRMMRKADIKTNFKPPRLVAGKIPETTQQHRRYANTDTVLGLIELLEKRGDSAANRGDLTMSNGEPMFNRAPILAVPALDANTRNPIYNLNRRSFKAFAMHGEWMRISEAQQIPNNHNMFEKWIDMTMQMVCLNRREQSVLQLI
jgi:hypothetical protein